MFDSRVVSLGMYHPPGPFPWMTLIAAGTGFYERRLGIPESRCGGRKARMRKLLAKNNFSRMVKRLIVMKNPENPGRQR
jgi:hypothetical protein